MIQIYDPDLDPANPVDVLVGFAILSEPIHSYDLL